MSKTSDRIIFLDAGAGISGDMFLGAMAGIATALDGNFDLGRALSAIALDGVEISVTEGERAGITGFKADVHEHPHHAHHH